MLTAWRRLLHSSVKSICHLRMLRKKKKDNVNWCDTWWWWRRQRHSYTWWSLGKCGQWSLWVVMRIFYIHIRIEPTASSYWIPLKWEAIVIIVMVTLILFLHGQQVESTARLDFIWKIQVEPKTFLHWTALVIHFSFLLA